jgi:hypothetical protein
VRGDGTVLSPSLIRTRGGLFCEAPTTTALHDDKDTAKAVPKHSDEHIRRRKLLV